MDATNCGCHVRAHLSDGKTLTGSIVYCPLHAAAPEMQAKLQAAEEMAEEAKGFLIELQNDPLFLGFYVRTARLQETITSWKKAGKETP